MIDPYFSKITYNKAVLEMTFWEPARVWAVCREFNNFTEPLNLTDIYST